MAVLRKEEEEKHVPRVEQEADRILIEGVFKGRGGFGCKFISLLFLIMTFFGYSYKYAPYIRTKRAYRPRQTSITVHFLQDSTRQTQGE